MTSYASSSHIIYLFKVAFPNINMYLNYYDTYTYSQML